MSVFVSDVYSKNQVGGWFQGLAGLFRRFLPHDPSHLPRELRGLPDRLLLDIGIDPRTVPDHRNGKTIGPHTHKAATDLRSRTGALS